MHPMTTPTIAQTMLIRAVERALRHWLFEIGRDAVAIRANAGGMSDLYHLAELRRVVLARPAVAA